MNAQQRELFRRALLGVLESNPTQYGLGLTSLQLHLGAFGFMASPLADVKSEMQYLEDKGFITATAKAISPENKTWRITAAGRDELAQQG